jgi:hypothetical protein
MMPGNYAELMHVYAISAAFGVIIQSYEPPTAALGLGTSPYTTTVVGSGVRVTSAAIFTLMWTATTLPTLGTDLHVNHIVLLQPLDTISANIVDSDADDADDDDDDGQPAHKV